MSGGKRPLDVKRTYGGKNKGFAATTVLSDLSPSSSMAKGVNWRPSNEARLNSHRQLSPQHRNRQRVGSYPPVRASGKTPSFSSALGLQPSPELAPEPEDPIVDDDEHTTTMASPAKRLKHGPQPASPSPRNQSSSSGISKPESPFKKDHRPTKLNLDPTPRPTPFPAASPPKPTKGRNLRHSTDSTGLISSPEMSPKERMSINNIIDTDADLEPVLSPSPSKARLVPPPAPDFLGTQMLTSEPNYIGNDSSPPPSKKRKTAEIPETSEEPSSVAIIIHGTPEEEPRTTRENHSASTPAVSSSRPTSPGMKIKSVPISTPIPITTPLEEEESDSIRLQAFYIQAGTGIPLDAKNLFVVLETDALHIVERDVDMGQIKWDIVKEVSVYAGNEGPGSATPAKRELSSSKKDATPSLPQYRPCPAFIALRLSSRPKLEFAPKNWSVLASSPQARFVVALDEKPEVSRFFKMLGKKVTMIKSPQHASEFFPSKSAPMPPDVSTDAIPPAASPQSSSPSKSSPSKAARKVSRGSSKTNIISNAPPPLIEIDESQDSEPITPARHGGRLARSTAVSLRKSGQDTVLVYPKGQPDAVTIRHEDLERLEPDQFLNDSLIDFYLRYLKEKFKSKKSKIKVHMFNSYFFSAASEDNRKSDSFEANKWTKDLNIFEYDFIFVPVNERLHWKIAVICYPRNAAKPYDSVPDNEKPAVLTFDSLNSNATSSVSGVLRAFLTKEAKAKSFPSADKPCVFDKNTLTGWQPKPSKQVDASSCGVYVLEYAESFLNNIPETLVKSSYNAWVAQYMRFSPADIEKKRVAVAKLIHSIAAEYNNPRLPNDSNTKKLKPVPPVINVAGSSDSLGSQPKPVERTPDTPSQGDNDVSMAESTQDAAFPLLEEDAQPPLLLEYEESQPLEDPNDSNEDLMRPE